MQTTVSYCFAIHGCRGFLVRVMMDLPAVDISLKHWTKMNHDCNISRLPHPPWTAKRRPQMLCCILVILLSRQLVYTFVRRDRRRWTHRPARLCKGQNVPAMVKPRMRALSSLWKTCKIETDNHCIGNWRMPCVGWEEFRNCEVSFVLYVFFSSSSSRAHGSSVVDTRIQMSTLQKYP